MHFTGFLRIQILEMPKFRELCSQGKEQPDTELFLLYYATCWNGGRKEENCGWGDGRDEGN